MLTPEKKNLNATNFWATNPFEMRLQNLKQERNVIYSWNQKAYKNHGKLRNYFNIIEGF